MTRTRNLKPETRNSRILAVIPARGGSKGLKNKNILPLCGKPVISYTIDFALHFPLFDRVVVSTDDSLIENVARKQRVQIIRRPATLARDTSPIVPVLVHAVNTLKQSENYFPDVVVLLYANVPVRNKEMVERVVKHIMRTRCDAVFTFAAVEKHHPNWMVELKGDRVKYAYPSVTYRRQELKKLYLHDGGCVAVRTKSLLKKRPNTHLYSSFGDDIRGVAAGKWDFVEIDTQYDLKLAEFILTGGSVQGAGSRKE